MSNVIDFKSRKTTKEVYKSADPAPVVTVTREAKPADHLEDLRRIRIKISIMRGFLARIDRAMPYTTGITRDEVAATLLNAEADIKKAYERLFPHDPFGKDTA